MNNFPSEFKNNSSHSLGFSFIKSYNLWHKKIKERLGEINLTHPQFVVLTTIGYLAQNENEVKQIDISKRSNIDVMTLSSIVLRLEKYGLVSRKKSLSDTRAKIVTLTKEGFARLGDALPIVEQVDREFFGVLEDQGELFNSLLLRLVDLNDQS